MTTLPQGIDIDENELAVTWADDHVGRYDLVALRRACSCAACTEFGRQGETIWPRTGAPDVLRVEEAELVGAWGLSLRWNDGHETGIYSWDVLRSLCECSTCSS